MLHFVALHMRNKYRLLKRRFASTMHSTIATFKRVTTHCRTRAHFSYEANTLDGTHRHLHVSN